MKLVFLGTRGYIEPKSRRHRLHTSLLVRHGASRVRRHPGTGELFGHATVRQQLGWCAEEGVPRMIVTHCGSDIVAGDERQVGARLREMARERGVEVESAHDGMEFDLTPG